MAEPGGATHVWDRFLSIAVSHGKKTAIIEPLSGNRITYEELKNSAVKHCELFSHYPIDAIAIIGEPDIDLIPLMLTCAIANKCFLPLNEDEPVSRFLNMFDQISLNILILSRHEIKKLSSISKGTRDLGGKNVFVYLKKTETTLIKKDPLYLLTGSSGSTGEPKLIKFSQKTKVKRTDQSINLFRVTSDDVVLSASPMHHSLGQRHFFVALLSGATLVKVSPFNPKLWLEAVQTFNVTFAIPVATHLKILKPYIDKNPDLLSGLRCLVTSSATADPDLKSRLLQNSSFELWEIYGMTETACATAVQFTSNKNVGHVGRAIEGTRIRINQADSSESGEIEVLSDCLCDGYIGNQALWESSLTKDGYFRSGDLGSIDLDNNLAFLGRTSESFESCGLLVFPAEIERVAVKITGVQDCVAFPVPNPIFGNLIGLALVTNASLDQRNILTHLREELPKSKVPAQLFLRDHFPTLASGKLDKKRLIQEVLLDN